MPDSTYIFWLFSLVCGLACCAAALVFSPFLMLARSRLGEVAASGRPAARRVGPYVLLSQIGSGGMGEVYRARHLGSGSPCAVKLLPRGASAREQARFESEASLSARLSHPNTISVYEHGRSSDGTRYYAMELVAGITLQRLVEQGGPLPAERVTRILMQLCAALDAVHANGLVHRDIKPDNILISRDGSGRDRIKLVDFGLATEVGASAGDGAGSVVGTPLYISPEAIAAPDSVDARSDLYGLGAVAYFLLTGAPVFEGRNVIEVCSHHLHSEPKPLPREVSRKASDLEQLVLQCLAKDANARPESAASIAERLERCLDRAAQAHAPSQRPAQVLRPAFAKALSLQRSGIGMPEERRACA